MTYGKRFTIENLAEKLEDLAYDIHYDIHDNEDYEDIIDRAKDLMEGSTELWKCLMEGIYCTKNDYKF